MNETKEMISTKVEQKLTNQGSSLLNAVNSLAVRNEVENNAILDIVAKAKKGKKIVQSDEELNDMDKATKNARKKCIALINKFIDPLDEVIKIGLKKSKTWLSAEQAKREAQQRKLDAEREAKEEAERKRVAEKQRKLDEAFEKKQEAERKRVADLKAEAEAKGKTSTAVEKEITRQVAVEKEIPHYEVPQVAAPANTSYTDHYSAEVVNLMGLCKDICDLKMPVNSVMANMPVLNSLSKIALGVSNTSNVKYIKNTTITQR